MPWKLWLHALAATTITGTAHGVASILAAMTLAPNTFNMGAQFWPTIQLAATSGVFGGLVSMSAYLSKSPIPDESEVKS